MPKPEWKSKILARRASFLAAALAGVGVAASGCDKDKPTVVDAEPQPCLSAREAPPSFDADALPHPCLSPRFAAPSPTNDLVLDTDYPLVIRAGADPIVEGTVRVKVVGAPVPRAANVAAGPLMQARIRSCLIDATKDDKKISGSIELTLELGSDGRITKSSATSAGDCSEELRKCIVRNTRGLGFHDLGEGKTSNVIVTLTFPKKE